MPSTPQYEKHEILIWGKTYPELSSKYGETVCTGGVLKDGRPVRLYPIPFRYLEGEKKFRLYDVISARITPNRQDCRPESFKLDPESIEVIGHVNSDPKEWSKRAAWMFKDSAWQFDSYDDLDHARETRGASIGVVTPAQILDITIEPRPDGDRDTFETRLSQIRDKSQQEYMFATIPKELKTLEYVDQRLNVIWRCASPNCGKTGGHATHSMQVLDWGTIELQRKMGIEAALLKLSECLTLEDYATRLFLGNFHSHQNRFGIVGLWYPKRKLAPLSETIEMF